MISSRTTQAKISNFPILDFMSTDTVLFLFLYPVLTSTRSNRPSFRIARSQEHDELTALKTSNPFERRSAHTRNSFIAPVVADGNPVPHFPAFRLFLAVLHFLLQYFWKMGRTASKNVPQCLHFLSFIEPPDSAIMRFRMPSWDDNAEA
jgi:hypothetical protein